MQFGLELDVTFITSKFSSLFIILFVCLFFFSVIKNSMKILGGEGGGA